MAVCGDCSLVESVGVEAGMAVCGDEFLAGCRQPPHPRMFGNFCGQSIRRRDRPGSPDDLRRVKTERPRGHEALVKLKSSYPFRSGFFPRTSSRDPVAFGCQ